LLTCLVIYHYQIELIQKVGVDPSASTHALLLIPSLIHQVIFCLANASPDRQHLGIRYDLFSFSSVPSACPSLRSIAITGMHSFSARLPRNFARASPRTNGYRPRATPPPFSQLATRTTPTLPPRPIRLCQTGRTLPVSVSQLRHSVYHSPRQRPPTFRPVTHKGTEMQTAAAAEPFSGRETLAISPSSMERTC
jgi:hypothetical protein